MKPDTTICIASYNAWEALALCVESFRKWHEEPVVLYILDNGSTDGAKEYAEAIADRMFYEDRPISHGENLTTMVAEVDTPYVMTLDNDIEFRAPVLDYMRDALNEEEENYCVCPNRLWPFGDFTIYGVQMKAMWSPEITCGLMKTDKIHRLMQWASFGYYMNEHRREHGETGAMIYRLAMASGYNLIELPELWDRITHWAGMSSMFRMAEPRQDLIDRYEQIKEHLRALRQEGAMAWAS